MRCREDLDPDGRVHALHELGVQPPSPAPRSPGVAPVARTDLPPAPELRKRWPNHQPLQSPLRATKLRGAAPEAAGSAGKRQPTGCMQRQPRATAAANPWQAVRNKPVKGNKEAATATATESRANPRRQPLASNRQATAAAPQPALAHAPAAAATIAAATAANRTTAGSNSGNYVDQARTPRRTLPSVSAGALAR